jgi:tetratricopeptide (TPR) repeat protein
MKRLALVFGLLTSVLSPCGFAQSVLGGSNAQERPIDRTEILGRLALAYSPSYVGYLVETRGVSFAPSADFMSLVKIAGGDGILIDRLTSVDTPAVNSSAERDKPIDHLAKCAELLHSGATESAEPECRAAIEESPQSPWPLLIVAKFLVGNSFFPNPSEIEKAKTAERGALLARATALAPDSQAVHFYQPDLAPVSNGSAEWQKAYALDIDELSIAESRDNGYPPPFFFDLGEASLRSPVALPRPAALNTEYRDQLDLGPEIASKHKHLAQLYMNARDFDRAQSELLEAVRLEPDNSDHHTELAVLFLLKHDRDSCLAELREAARIVPVGVQQHISLSAALESAGHTTEAVAGLKMLIDAHPADVSASNTLVQMYVNQKNRKAAIEELRRSLKVTSPAYTDESEFVDARYQDEQQLAYLLQEDRQFDAATEQFLFLLHVKPDNAGLHNDYGNVLLDQHDEAAAVDEYYAALRLDPQMSEAHNNIGLCLAHQKDLDGAIAEFRKALDINPNEPHTRIYLGTALGQKGDRKAATDQFEHAIQGNPKDAETQGGVAFALMQLKDEAGAIAHLKAALELQPDSPAAENNLAWLYATAENLKLQKPPEALVLARRAVETSPSQNPAFLDTLAEAQLLNGQPTEALATETKALALDPDNPELQSRLAHFREAANASANSTSKVAVAK